LLQLNRAGGILSLISDSKPDRHPMPLLFEPRIFKRFPNVRAALTQRSDPDAHYAFNMSLTVGDDQTQVRANRARLAERLGFDPDRLAPQRQVHGCTVRRVADGYTADESDALITSERGWLLAVSVADCVPVLIYDAARDVIAGVHSGWRGTEQNIAGTTLDVLRREHHASASDLHVYIGAAASQCCYEVGDDVASRFDAKYSRPIGDGKYLFDNKGAVLDQILRWGVPPAQIELDPRCTICDGALHSYRRDGSTSGRMFAVIGLLP
jgi:YfiH family protein